MTVAVTVLSTSSKSSLSVVTVSVDIAWPAANSTVMGAWDTVAPDSITDTITVTERVVSTCFPPEPPTGLKIRSSVKTTSSPSVAVAASAMIEISMSGPSGVAVTGPAGSPSPLSFTARTSNEYDGPAIDPSP